MGGAGGRGRVEEGRYGQQGGAARQAAGEAVSGVGHPVHSQSSETSRAGHQRSSCISGIQSKCEDIVKYSAEMITEEHDAYRFKDKI